MTRPWFGAVLALVLTVVTLAVFGRLPEQIPTHWNVHGEVDGWAPRFPGAFLMPAVLLGIWALALVLPRIDPRRAHLEAFRATYWLQMNAVLLFLAAVGAVALAAALGWPIAVGTVVGVGVGVLLIAVGNYLPRVKSNWWMGIRNPWTLSDDEVWRKTHRLGGRLFVLAGGMIVASAFLAPDLQLAMLLTAVAIAAVVPNVYSYLQWRKRGRPVG